MTSNITGLAGSEDLPDLEMASTTRAVIADYLLNSVSGIRITRHCQGSGLNLSRLVRDAAQRAVSRPSGVA